MDFLKDNLAELLTGLFVILSAIFGTKFTNIRSKLSKSFKEIIDILDSVKLLVGLIEKIDENNKATDEQIAAIKAQGKQVGVEVKELVAIWKKDPAVPVQ